MTKKLKLIWTYELCKKLKDAGFPQEYRMGHWICKHELLDPSLNEKYDDCYGEDLIYYPTLSELIEACGTPLEIRVTSNSTADAKKMNLDNTTIALEVGQTPEEAVALLYLTLHENDKKN